MGKKASSVGSSRGSSMSPSSAHTRWTDATWRLRPLHASPFLSPTPVHAACRVADKPYGCGPSGKHPGTALEAATQTPALDANVSVQEAMRANVCNRTGPVTRMTAWPCSMHRDGNTEDVGMVDGRRRSGSALHPSAEGFSFHPQPRERTTINFLSEPAGG